MLLDLASPVVVEHPVAESLCVERVELSVLELSAPLVSQLHTRDRIARPYPALNSSQAAAALRSASDALGAAGRLQIVGDRATLTLTAASSTQLRDWLAEARSAARARPLEANLTRGPQGYSGSIVVVLPGAGLGP